MAIFGQFLFPINATPKQRWMLLVSYWLLLLLGIAIPFRYIHELQVSIRTMAIAPAPTYLLLLNFVHSIWNCPLLLWVWNKTYVSHYDRPLRYFATVVYPLCHVVDTMLWISAIDFGSSYVARTFFTNSIPVVQIACGFVCVSCVIACHRITFEQWYLPQHHYPPDTDPIVKKTVIRFVLTACFGAFIMTCNRILHVNHYYHYYDHQDNNESDEHTTNDQVVDDTSLLVIVIVKYVFDTIIACTIHIPNPWDKNDNSYARNNAWKKKKQQEKET